MQMVKIKHVFSEAKLEQKLHRLSIRKIFSIHDFFRPRPDYINIFMLKGHQNNLKFISDMDVGFPYASME